EGGRVVPAGALLLEQERARGVQLVPAAVVFGMTDPDREVVADPAPGEEPVQGLPRGMLGEELAQANRADARVAHRLLVDRAEERDAAGGVMLPAVLAVEDDRDDRGRVVAAGLADGQYLAEEVGGRDRAGAALIVEADLVRHRMIAEDDRQLRLPLADLPCPVEPLGIADVTPAVAADQAARRTSQDLLVGRDPLDPLLRQEGDHRL